MSFTGELVLSSAQTGILQNHTFRVLDCDYKFHSPSDALGRITGAWRGGSINLIIETTEAVVDLSQVLVQMSVIEGTLKFMQRDSISAFLTISFKNARLVELETTFSSQGTVPLSNKLTITTEIMILETGGKEFELDNDWDGTR